MSANRLSTKPLIGRPEACSPPRFVTATYAEKNDCGVGAVARVSGNPYSAGKRAAKNLEVHTAPDVQWRARRRCLDFAHYKRAFRLCQ